MNRFRKKKSSNDLDSVISAAIWSRERETQTPTIVQNLIDRSSFSSQILRTDIRSFAFNFRILNFVHSPEYLYPSY